ncbi:MAG: MarR family winged helix-turn-helix transcriptional regulator [Hyphomicrobiales bacterium]|jgi:DNA-binding MarR family transcriptional regulator|nr:MarR family winged helix-turn-helix transcriptional regulator [Hyphomicrobiales bacterium]
MMVLSRPKPQETSANDAEIGTLPEGTGADLLSRQRLDAFTHARLWKNPCGFAARFNYLALRYNQPLYGWVEERFGLARIEFVVIFSLSLQDGITASEISASTAFAKNTLSRAVKRLNKLGYIMRRTDAIDRRQQFLSLSPAGRAVYEEALPRFVALEEEMLAPLSLVERETLSALMAKVVLAMFEVDVPERTPPPSRREN